MAMIVTIVHVYVKPEFIPQFIEATQRNHEHSINEPGNLRFDVLQDHNDPAKFVLYGRMPLKKPLQRTRRRLTMQDGATR